MHTTIYKIGKPQGPTVEHRELYSNIVIIYNGKESEKTYIYICIHPHTKLNHFAMHLKLIHCKLTILQLKSQEELLSEILLCATHYTVVCVCMCVCVCVCAQLCPTLCNPMDYSSPCSSVHGLSQARMLEWVAISFSNTVSESEKIKCHVTGGKR